MARRSKGSVYRKSTRTKTGRRVFRGFYRAKYIDANGQDQDRVIILHNGQRVTDQSVAEAELEKMLKREEHKAAGIIDPAVEAASMPMREVLARYVRQLRSRRRSRKHVKQMLSYAKRMMEHAGIGRLGEFNVDNIGRAPPEMLAN